eukprot:c21464_g1_i1.p1 GENE.c21464_g1_i1~~c21464_g1_i1.p1  ORF type:complete len:105 (+),score=38.87 c21464_g1_i1:161-475(+)
MVMGNDDDPFSLIQRDHDVQEDAEAMAGAMTGAMAGRRRKGSVIAFGSGMGAGFGKGKVELLTRYGVSLNDLKGVKTAPPTVKNVIISLFPLLYIYETNFFSEK